MQLSAEEFHSMLLAAGPLGARRSGEKRLHIRVGADAQVTILPLNASPLFPLQVHVHDISRRGIQIRHTQAMELGDQFILCLAMDGGRKTQTVVCVVRRVVARPKGQFEMGCEFDGDIQPAVPCDRVLKGLKKFQVELFELDMQAV
jgi:hypothetical protein